MYGDQPEEEIKRIDKDQSSGIRMIRGRMEYGYTIGQIGVLQRHNLFGKILIHEKLTKRGITIRRLNSR